MQAKDRLEKSNSLALTVDGVSSIFYLGLMLLIYDLICRLSINLISGVEKIVL